MEPDDNAPDTAAPPAAPPADTAAPDAGAAAWERLEAEAAAAEPAADAAAGEGGAAPELAAMDWSMAAAGLVGAFAVYANNWNLTQDESNRLASHAAAALQAWFPDVRADARWQALGGLALVAGGIAMTRRDASGRMLPLRKPAAGAPAGQVGPDTGGLVLRPAE